MGSIEYEMQLHLPQEPNNDQLWQWPNNSDHYLVLDQVLPFTTL